MNAGRHKITATGHQLDMTGWCVEKTLHVVEHLAELAESVPKMNISDDMKSSAMGHVRLALVDGTKLLSFATGATWDVNDSPEVVRDGAAGAERLARRYGAIGASSGGAPCQPRPAANDRRRAYAVATVSARDSARCPE